MIRFLFVLRNFSRGPFCKPLFVTLAFLIKDYPHQRGFLFPGVPVLLTEKIHLLFKALLHRAIFLATCLAILL